MNTLRYVVSIYTKQHDLAQAPLFRKYGAKGMRRFYIVWGACTYLILIVTSGIGLHALTQVDEERGSRFIVFTAVTLIVAATSLLTRMLIGIFSELRALESQMKTD